MELMSALQGPDDQKPSLFEILSEQQLASLLPPTLRYALVIATQRYPRYLLPVLNSFDELYALLQLVVDGHYLRTSGGSFTESFYGLRRARAPAADIRLTALAAPTSTRKALALNSRDVWRNLAVLVALPYAKRRLDEAYEIESPRALLGLAYTQMPSNPTIRQRLLHYCRWFLRNIYPSVNAAYYFSLLAFNLAYLFDNSQYQSPFLWLIGTRIRRMSPADYQAIDAAAAAASKKAAEAAASRSGLWSALSPRNLSSRALSSLSVVLPMSIFALKFLEWWHSSDFARQLSRRAAGGLELPPPIVSGIGKKAKVSSGKGVLRNHSEPAPSTSDEKKAESKEVGEAPNKRSVDGHTDDPSVEDAPVALPAMLPIYTVPTPTDSSLCPICEDDVATATACPSGVVYCYTCIHRWVTGEHPRQEAFMEGREGKWDSGAGRCAVTGRRILGGTEGLRRIMV